ESHRRLFGSFASKKFSQHRVRSDYSEEMLQGVELRHSIIARRSGWSPPTQMSFARTTGPLGHFAQLSGSAVTKIPNAPQFVMVCSVPLSPFSCNSPTLLNCPSGAMSQAT